MDWARDYQNDTMLALLERALRTSCCYRRLASCCAAYSQREESDTRHPPSQRIRKDHTETCQTGGDHRGSARDRRQYDERRRTPRGYIIECARASGTVASRPATSRPYRSPRAARKSGLPSADPGRDSVASAGRAPKHGRRRADGDRVAQSQVHALAAVPATTQGRHADTSVCRPQAHPRPCSRCQR